jgi:integral membrane protein (TIGR01906 family)
VTRAPVPVGLAFAIAAALAITLTGPLLLFNPWFVSFEQARHDVPARLGTDQPTVDRLTGSMLGDLFLNGDFTVSLDGEQPVLDASERSHMRDVGGLVRALVLIEVVALAALLITGWRLRAERARRGRLLLVGAAVVGGAAVMGALVFALAFDVAFAAFHSLFFAAGTWQFGADSNLLRLFPQPFWSELSLVAGVVIALSAVAVALLGRRDLALAPATATG